MRAKDHRRYAIADHVVLEEGVGTLLPETFDPRSPHVVTRDGSLALVRVVGARDPFDVDFSRALLADVEARLAGFDVSAIGGYAVARSDAVATSSSLRVSPPMHPKLAIRFANTPQSGAICWRG